MTKLKIAIIGGGASGLFTASLLNDLDLDVTLFEKNDKLGKKILASGNGKCNFTNIENNKDKYNNEFANKVVDRFNVNETLDAFTKLGLIYKHDDQGRYYPVSESATSVLDCLKSGLSKVKLKLDCLVENVKVINNVYKIIYNDKEEIFDYIVCCSGSSASNLGSEKSYSYLNNLGIKFNAARGSLTPLIVKENVKSLFGVRVKCLVKLLNNQRRVIYQENGEVIFKDNGISGIAIFNVSSYINRNINENYIVSLDISNNMNYNELKKYFKNKNKDNIFKGFLNDKLGYYISQKCNLDKVNLLEENVIDNIINILKSLEFNIVGLYPLRDSQVCSGGVSLEEINPNLNLKKYPRMYVGGELLDIDGVCGGYNLQFAWSSGGVIANDIKSKLNNK